MANAVPDTDSVQVAALAVAWEIVKSTYITGNTMGTRESGTTELTNAVIKAYNAITAMKAIEK